MPCTSDVITICKIPTSRLDNEPTKIHFANGFFCTETCKFFRRTQPHLVTDVISYDYDESFLADIYGIKRIHDDLSKLFTSNEAFDISSIVSRTQWSIAH